MIAPMYDINNVRFKPIFFINIVIQMAVNIAGIMIVNVVETRLGIIVCPKVAELEMLIIKATRNDHKIINKEVILLEGILKNHLVREIVSSSTPIISLLVYGFLYIFLQIICVTSF